MNDKEKVAKVYNQRKSADHREKEEESKRGRMDQRNYEIVK